MSLLSVFLTQYSPQTGWGTFFTAGFGAFAGAYAASRAQTKRAIVAELNALSSAQTLCFSICNRFLALKSQHVSPMKLRFDEANKRRKKFLSQPAATRGAFEFAADFQTITPLALPSDALEKIIFEKTSIRGRALVALVDLVGAIDGVRSALEERATLAAEIRNRQGKTNTQLAEMYFGLKTPDGHIDERYPSNLLAIHAQTDDCIFFSRILAADLVRYGNKLRSRFAWRYRLGIPKMRDADWSIAERAQLIPPDTNYQKWLQGFPPQPARFAAIKARFGLRSKVDTDRAS